MKSKAKRIAPKPAKPDKRSVRAGARSAKKQVSKRVANARSAGRSAAVTKPATRVKGPSVCPECQAIYYDKHWHAATLVPAKARRRKLASSKCEVCHAKVGFVGEVMIEGLKSGAVRQQVLQLIRNVGKRASRRDPLDRIVHLHDDGAVIRVLTSENQLAVSIGKQVDRARKGGRLEIVWSDDDKPVRVHWRAKAK